MASSTWWFCGAIRPLHTLARQWYGHTAGIFLLWTRLATPFALAGALWNSGVDPYVARAWPGLLVGPGTAGVYALLYVLVPRIVRVPLARLKLVDTLLLAGASFATAALLELATPRSTTPACWLAAMGLTACAWYLNWCHGGSAEQPGTGSLPVAPSFTPPACGPVTAGYRGYDRSHTGVDLGIPTGTPVLAPADGRVTWAGPQGQWGYTVCLDHGDGWSTLFAHLDRVLVQWGQTAAAGARIALSGTSGISTGPHLHMELRYRNVPVDPAPLLDPVHTERPRKG